ncbi:MAG TPA: hypothetical protein VEL74_14980 [Thermoanaerobaculia bacterium]|nr:hypothetical protein [Thermoanaerobaculia bacterium]
MSGVSQTPNAFAARFLSRLGERDEPPTAGEAAVAGPWRIEQLPGRGFGLFRAGKGVARGGRPAAICPSRWVALAFAAMLPGTGRDPMLRLGKEADGEGMYPVTLDTGEVVARLEVFDDTLIERVNALIHLLQSPQSLADALEAAGAEALDACGSLLDERIAPPEATPLR